MSARGHEDVSRLDVAVQDSRGVCGLERFSDLDPESRDRFRLHGAEPGASRQRLTFEQFHDDEAPSALLVDVVYGADVGMVQRRSSARFALEPLQRLRIAVQRLGQELQRDPAAQPRVFCAVDDAHPARAQPLEDAVMGNSLSDHGSAGVPAIAPRILEQMVV